MPHLTSNIPSKMFYAVYGTEILRIVRITSSKVNFINHCPALISRMVSLGVSANTISKTLSKISGIHSKTFISLQHHHNLLNLHLKKVHLTVLTWTDYGLPFTF